MEASPVTPSPAGSLQRLREACPVWVTRTVRWCLRLTWRFIQFLLIAWASLAIYYGSLPLGGVGLLLAILFAGFGVWALWLARRPRMPMVFAGAFAVVWIWFATLRPSHDREWRPEVAVMPRVAVEGDLVRISGVRHFDYRTQDDFTIHYEEREVMLSHLVSVDLFVSYWKPGPVAHTFLSFNFDNAPPVCISIETRPEKTESFAPVASMFKQFELIYIVGDERDIVRVRTNYRGEQVYLYPILTSPEGARRLFRIYLERINELEEKPEFYHLLKNNCTLNILRYANRAGRKDAWDLRHWLNGLIDRYVYAVGAVDTTLPFDELRKRSHINEAAEAADDAPDFSERIRTGLPEPDQ